MAIFNSYVKLPEGNFNLILSDDLLWNDQTKCLAALMKTNKN